MSARRARYRRWVVRFFRRLPSWVAARSALRELWERARRERSSPRELGWSFGVGAFIACTPLIGLHAWVALGVATLLRLNRLWAFLGSRLSSSPILLATTFCEIEVAHRLRTGVWAPLELRHALDHGREMLLDWCLGSVLVGGLIAVVGGTAAYAIALRFASRTATAAAPLPRAQGPGPPEPPRPSLPSPRH